MSKKQGYFIAGTDTDAGKTLVACGLLARAKVDGLSTAAVKPVAAGCEETPDGLRNDDAEQLLAQSTLPLYYEQVNPIAFAPPIAPHIAAAKQGMRMNAGRLAGFTRGVLMLGADLTIVEGAGGWRVPLNERETLAELPKQLQLPVILVVGMKLGCISHTLLTVEAIKRDGLRLAGWVANHIDPDMSEFEANLETLKTSLAAPLLGVVPHLQETDSLALAKAAASHLVLPTSI
jgi:dethiobiotin synthetase